MIDERPREEIHPLAPLYALGALDEPEAGQFEAHLRDGCPECGAEVREFEAIVQQLAFSTPPVTPRPQLREKLLARISKKVTNQDAPDGAQVWKAWTPTPEIPRWVVHSNEGEWQKTGFEGVTAKNLFVDDANNLVTMLVRMEPRSAYPSHRHSHAEQCYLIQGDLHVGAESFEAGDYLRNNAGSIDEEISTVNGCLLFIISSQQDELLF
ncbi:MAG: cupin domain-containing protein [Acidobacteria bacterium]|nr:cupin domain-containing protein [Acidobacteriota bacterium]